MQGFNMGRYVPPDEEGVRSGNQIQGKHALGARASKLDSQGILTVRFEMPFAVWCTSCTPAAIIGQGTRFNAEKKRVGRYHTSTIWAFRMRHTACGGAIEIRTDPANTEYVVMEGGRRREVDGVAKDDSLVTGSHLAAAAGIQSAEAQEKERLDSREGAFKNLEKTIADRAQQEQTRLRIDELQEVAARDWEDPYERNQRLRRSFRAGRKVRERDAEVTEELQSRMGIGLDLLPGTEEDTLRASLVHFGALPADEETSDRPMRKVLARPLFPSKAQTKAKEGPEQPNPRRPLKSEISASRMRHNLVAEIVGNTRAAKDPFLDFGSREPPKSMTKVVGIKRKRDEDNVSNLALDDKAPKQAPKTGLVSYVSDSDS